VIVPTKTIAERPGPMELPDDPGQDPFVAKCIPKKQKTVTGYK
jgi:hypothetical protein